MAGSLVGDAVEGGNPVGVGQIQIEQHAVGSACGQFPLGVGNRRRPGELDVDAGVGDQFFDQQRVGSVVLHQEHRQASALRRTGDVGRVLRVMRRAHRPSRPSRNVTPVALTPSLVTTAPNLTQSVGGPHQGEHRPLTLPNHAVRPCWTGSALRCPYRRHSKNRRHSNIRWIAVGAVRLRAVRRRPGENRHAYAVRLQDLLRTASPQRPLHSPRAWPDRGSVL